MCKETMSLSMMNFTSLLLFLTLVTLPLSFSQGSSFYSLSAEDVNGAPVSLDKYRGKVLLVVNVASECGYTDLNYKELVKLQNDYQDRGFTVLAFPCNQFGQQEPASTHQVLMFAEEKYGVGFPIFAKTEVVGEGACPLYQHLRGRTGSVPSWNFGKYLVDRAGEVVQFFSEREAFSDIRTSVEYLLRKTDEL